jgi:hypothetical protein
VNTVNKVALDDLRSERHRLSEDVARLAWLRRLVVARCDLEVARLVGVVAAPGELPEDVRAALAGHTATLAPETLLQLAACARALAASVAVGQQRLDDATRELVERYTEDPRRCLTGAGAPAPAPVRS